MKSTRVLIVDSHPLMADSLSDSVEQNSRFETRACPSYTDVPSHVDAFHPHIIVVNVHQDAITEGLEACRAIAVLPGDHMIVFLAPRRLVMGEMFTVDAVEAGADGVLIHEELDLPQLVEALEDLESGRSLFDVDQVDQLREALIARGTHSDSAAAVPPEIESLTPREREVANLIAAGASTDKIAKQLTISERTVQSHMSSILSKLGVRTRAEAVVQLYRWRLSTRKGHSTDV